ncbi:MAG: PEGA domain-containing protein, partial [Spirochaetota bacterium]
ESLPEYQLNVGGSARESETLFLEPGFHDVVFETPGYQTFSATAAVEEGQQSRLSVELEPHPASLFLDAPRGTQVYIDDTIIGSRLGTSIELEPGEHELMVRIGGRSVTRMLQLEPGRSYTARVEFDLTILESDAEASEESENGNR